MQNRTSLLALAGLLTLIAVGCGSGDTSDSGDRADTAAAPDSLDSTDSSTAPDTADAACQPECDAGATRCDAGGLSTCADPGDGCLTWSTPMACEAGMVCQGGGCVEACPDQECTAAGARKCSGDGAGVLECGDHDGDGCLDWGAPAACDEGLVCSQGFCEISCSDECTVAGARKCDGSSVVSCQDHDTDGCLEWGGAEDCGDLACSGGFCTSACADDCTVAGARKCDGNGVSTCGDHNGDGCLDWGTVVPCDQGQTCSSGFCASGCSDECEVVGGKKCDLDQVVACGDYDSDDCLEWGSPTPCETGLVCSAGNCQTECSNGCAVAGTNQCQGGGVVTCEDYNDDGCLEWGTPVYCGDGQSCELGFCTETCADGCTVSGAKKCDGDDIVTCGNHDEDGCLEWGAASPCEAGLVCSGGNCQIECADECTVSGAKTCDGDAIVACGNHDGDGCLEWSQPSACAAGLVCSAGNCKTECADECTVVGAKACQAGGVSACGDHDSDACLEWGAPTPCEGGLVCAAGFCQSECADECTVAGAKHCDPAGGVAVCGDANDDGCLEWGTPVACAEPLVCAGGNCTQTCSDECDVASSKQCVPGVPGQFQVCGEYDGDGCLEWGNAEACDKGLACAGGSCVNECVDACTVAGAKQCQGGGVATCGDYDENGCLEWGTVVYCDEGQTCQSGFCTETCVSACTAVGAKKCDGDAVVVCGEGSGGCLDWGDPVACGGSETCSNGHCSATCSDECTVVGAKQCDPSGAVTICGEHDADACLEWGAPALCDAPYVCSQGNCALTCTDECDVENAKGCVTGSDSQYQVCGEHDGDGCLEWGSAEDCADDLVCSDGNCTSTCESTCAVGGDTICEGNGTRTCGDYNDDGCLEWGTVAYCEPFETCSAGTCATQPPPATVVISELFYDAEGGDSDAFVELHGPPGTDLSGFALEGVNGNGGATYNPISLGGVIPSHGLFVVANSAAAPWVADQADLLSGAADYQNGPDSLRLLFGDTVVDAIGYGDFSSATFAGEGAPAPDVAGGQSLARDPDFTDTGDNLSDFAVLDPTPGAPNVAANQPPVAALGCPDGGTAGEALTFDASASADPDGSVVTYAFGFGDGSGSTSGASAQASHTYASAGSWTVTLTVTDDAGATDTATCQVVVEQASSGDAKPTASFVAAVTGSTSVTVDASASSDVETPTGDLVVRWDFDNDGTWDTAWSATRVAEHTYPSSGTWTIRLQVKDLAGQTDTDTTTVSLSTAQYVSGTTETETWSGTVIVTSSVTVAEGHTLTISPGTQVLAMYVDAGDGTGSVGITGAGRIDVQGTAAAPVLFTVYQASQKQPSAWAGLTLQGKDSTVTHATIEYAHVGLVFEEVESVSVSHTTVRYCHEGIQHTWLGSSELTHVTATHNTQTGLSVTGSYKGTSTASAVACTFSHNGVDGVYVDDNGDLTLAESTVAENARAGLYVERGTLAMIGTHVHDNAGSGLWLEGSFAAATATVDASTIEGNHVGIFYEGKAGGSVTASTIRNNARAGIQLETRHVTSHVYDPTPSITGSNIYDNATEGGYGVSHPDVLFNTQRMGSGTHYAPAFTTPTGGLVEWIRLTYDDWGNSVTTAKITDAAEGGSQLQSFSDDVTDRFWPLGEHAVTSVKVGIQHFNSFSYAQIAFPTVIYGAPTVQTQLLAVTIGGTIDATGNYWGTPDPADALTLSRPDAADATSPSATPIPNAAL